MLFIIYFFLFYLFIHLFLVSNLFIWEKLFPFWQIQSGVAEVNQLSLIQVVWQRYLHRMPCVLSGLGTSTGPCSKREGVLPKNQH